ncbi:hypothetical protein ACWGRS_10185 [Cellulosimicrobium funkei]
MATTTIECCCATPARTAFTVPAVRRSSWAVGSSTSSRSGASATAREHQPLCLSA